MTTIRTRRERRIRAAEKLFDTHEARTIKPIDRALRSLARQMRADDLNGAQTLIEEPLRDFRQTLSGILLRNGMRAAEASGRLTLGELETKAAIDIMLESIRRWLNDYAPRRAELVTNFLRRRIQAQLDQGQDAIIVWGNIQRIILVKGAAARIARTEIHTATERGAFEGARSLGVRVAKEWVSRRDGRVRLDHAIADGQIQEIDTPFSVGGENLMYPGDPAGSARNVIQCRCVALYHLIVNGRIQR